MARFADLSPAETAELWAVLALRHAEAIGPRRARRIVAAFGSARAAAEQCLASPRSWKGLATPAACGAFASGSWRAAARNEWDALRNGGFIFLLHSDPDYPESLRDIDDAPLLLYCRGDLSLLAGPAVAVVGSRDCTREGIALTAFIARDLSGAGVTVVSGMAKGIDRAAHLAAMEGPGRTIAVLGTGIDVPYPTGNQDIYSLLCEKGLVLSEFAPGVTARPAHFPVRNRLISGLSQGVLVVQAAGRSGSLITARLALEQNRSVFAAPGHPFSAESAGCHELIRNGAIPVFRADDILADLAPLLTLEARKALEKRRAAEAKQKKSGARDSRKEPHEEAVQEARALLPEGDLPWVAPSRTGKGDGTAGKLTAPGPLSGSTVAPPPVQETSGRRARCAASPENADRLPPDCPDCSPEEKALLEAVAAGPVHIDVLCRTLDCDVAGLSARLILLEVRGLVRRLPGMYYQRT